MTSRPLMQEMFASALYKRNQGRMVRQVTCLTIWLVAAVAAWRCHTLFIAPNLGEGNKAVGYLLAVGLGALGCWFGYRLVNWPKFADFLISVEAELNKVSWPTQKELVRASIVVIFTILFMSAVLFAYDAIWRLLFTSLGIAK
ncbi:MAG: preprotein translocase subunit SecE [Pirellulaceae bacterium]